MPLKRRASPTPETPVEELRNLAKVSAGWLRAVGVTTYGQLCEHELFDLWMALRLQFPQVNRLMYYGMWGALHDLDWRQIPEAEKQRFSHLAEGLLGAPAPPRASGGAARRGPASPPRKRRT
ncbi:MAG: TfoX/Sxy family DNA transformation protein [Myxococcales bacterium]|nr:TfoX/Sxy family DNA transformation protein [Myxococcales bacterium]